MRVTDDQHTSEPSRATDAVAAGEFSEWLRGTEVSLQLPTDGAHVPCGACRGCCRSSMFIRIAPEETRTLERIPAALLFPAPGLPAGHVLMGYDEHGRCPMLVENTCSIYADRPQTCRDYDCRIFAATGVPVDEASQREIAARVSAWVFEYHDDRGRDEHRILKEAAAFLRAKRDLFPPGLVPAYPVQLAALAVRVYRLFSALRKPNGSTLSQPNGPALRIPNGPALSESNGSDLRRPHGTHVSTMSDADIALAIVSALGEPGVSEGRG
jgi:Fe-S-cluster containining protein